MRTTNLLGCLLLSIYHGAAFEVELKELVNPSVARVTDSPSSGRDTACVPRGCTGIFTRDGFRRSGSRYGCTQQDLSSSRNTCTVNYRLNEETFSGGTPYTISSVHVAFTGDSETTLRVIVDDDTAVESWSGVKGSTGLQEIPGVAGYSGDELELVAVMSEGSYIGITETEIYVEVNEVPVIGISASDRVNVTASATVKGYAAGKTLDGSTSKLSAWSCADGEVCEITYDMHEVQSTEQLRIAFVEKSSTVGAKFNVYTAGTDGVFSSVLSGVTAGVRDSSLAGLQTFGGVRKLARYVKIEGVPGSGGKFAISEVDIRVKKDAPAYPTTVDRSLVPLGRLPLGGSGSTYDPRPASEGGCSSGHFTGCHIYNIKDGIDSTESRWSCSPKTVTFSTSDICHVEFRLNGQTYLRQIQLAFHKGDERHTEFSIRARTEGGWVIAVPSAISSGDTTDFQTWDIPTFTSIIEIQPKFGGVGEWISVKEMILLGEQQSPDSTPILRYSNSEIGFTFDPLPLSALKTTFSFDLKNVDSDVDIDLGGDGQTARIWAVKMKFPSDKSFTFDIRYRDENSSLISTRFISAGGDEQWEEFALPKTVVTNDLEIVAVEGPGEVDYPALRVNDCQVLGEPYTAGSKTVASTTIDAWFVIPDYIGEGNGDQKEIMQAICDGIGEGYNGTDCDGVATGNDKTPEVVLLEGDYYVDGPVFLKNGISLLGERTDDGNTYATYLKMHGNGTGADGIINADGVWDVFVELIAVQSNLESAGPAGTVGNVGFDIKDSKDIIIDLAAGRDCPLAGGRFVNTNSVRANEFDSFGRGSTEGPEVVLDGVTDVTITESDVQGVMIKDSVKILFEGRVDDGDLNGAIETPKGGNQTANLVVSGNTSGVTLKDISITSGAEPRIILENGNPFTIDAVTISGGTTGDCIIQFPQGADGNAVLIQLNVETTLLLQHDCFVLA